MVSGYSTSTNLPRVDGLSMDPRDLGHHIMNEKLGMELGFLIHILGIG